LCHNIIFLIYFSQYDENLPPKTGKEKNKIKWKKQLNCILAPLSFGSHEEAMPNVSEASLVSKGTSKSILQAFYSSTKDAKFH
jgi:hypothetical protein